MTVGLIDVDSHNFPNLALMKLSAWHKARGDTVEWWWGFGEYDRVYMSKVFTDEYSPDVPEPLNAKEIIKGGTGYKLLEAGDYAHCVRHVKRNGCIGCATDIAFPDNHLQALRQTHPRAFEVFMARGLGDELAKLYKAKKSEERGGQCVLDGYDDGQFFGIPELLDRHPCAFEDMNEYLERDELTDSEYDAEQMELWEEPHEHFAGT